MKTIAFKSYGQLKKIKRPYILLVDSKFSSALNRTRLVVPKEVNCMWDFDDSYYKSYTDVSCFLINEFDMGYKDLVDGMRSYDKSNELKPTEIILL